MGVENFGFVAEAKNLHGQVQADDKAKFTVDLDRPEGDVEDPKIKVKHFGEGKYFILYPLATVSGEYHINFIGTVTSHQRTQPGWSEKEEGSQLSMNKDTQNKCFTTDQMVL